MCEVMLPCLPLTGQTSLFLFCLFVFPFQPHLFSSHCFPLGTAMQMCRTKWQETLAEDAKKGNMKETSEGHEKDGAKGG